MHATSVSAKSASPTDKFKLKHKNGSKDIANCLYYRFVFCEP